MNRSKKISILMMNFNHGELIWRAINAIKNQTLLPYELIIADDKSTDKSVDVINKLIKDFYWIKLITNKVNLGNLENANFLLSQVRTEFGLWASADDFLLPDIIERYDKYLSKHNDIGMITSTALFFSNDGFSDFYSPRFLSINPKFISAKNFSVEFKLHGNFIKGSTSLYNIKLLKKLKGFNLKLSSYADTVAACILSSQNGCIYDPFPGSVCERFSSGFASRTMRSPRNILSIMKELVNFKDQLNPIVYQMLLIPLFRRYFSVQHNLVFNKIWDKKNNLPFKEIESFIQLHMYFKLRTFKLIIYKFMGKHLNNINGFLFKKINAKYLFDLKISIKNFLLNKE